MKKSTYSVFGIGNPLMDLLSYQEHSFLTELGVQPGTMQLCSPEEMEKLLRKTGTCQQVPGGSCANTLRGLAWLNKYDAITPLVYSGAVGSDNRGNDYISLMENDWGIKTLISKKTRPTGFSLLIVTPDFERTMFTCLGACQEFAQEDLNLAVLKDTEILHFNGYMWDTDNQKAAITAAMDCARQNQVKVSFDLADPFVVNRNLADFRIRIGNSVDILFGNSEEFSILTGAGKEIDQIVQAAGSLARLAIVKAGAKGCYVIHKGSVIYVPGRKVKAIDTVGAGDSFAAGFLYSMLKEWDLADCAGLANTVAAHIVSVEGCNFNKLDSRKIFEQLSA